MTKPTPPLKAALLVTTLLAFPSTVVAQLTVSRVIDGDTFVLSDQRRVRLIGIDAPETRQPRDDDRTEADRAVLRQLAEVSSDFLRQLVTGRSIELDFDDAAAATSHLDRYGRTLAYVWVLEDGRRVFMANRRMVSEGYAAAYTNYPFMHAADFLEQQRLAREARRGLWADSVGAVPLPLEKPTVGVPAGRDVDCSDFKTQREAQAFYVAAGPGDPHGLDENRDGIACEALPPRRSSRAGPGPVASDRLRHLGIRVPMAARSPLFHYLGATTTEAPSRG
jgi:micrococcal nuclease